VTEIFNAGNKYFSELGNRNLVKICILEADNVLNNSIDSFSTALKPFTAPTSTGKKAISADITILEVIPLPNHNINNGARANNGVACIIIA